MAKIIAAINMSLDGYCDHTSMSGDEDVHDFFSEQLQQAELLLYGRITYQLMEDFWPSVAKSPSGIRHIDDFAIQIDHVPKLVYTRTLQKTNWHNASIKNEIRSEEVRQLKKDLEKDIFAGSPSLIVQLSQLHLVDEYRLVVHPVVVGSGLPLFNNISQKINLRLIRTEPFKNGAVVLYYEAATP